MSEPLKQSATEVGRDLVNDVKESGAQLVDSAKDHASSAMQNVKDATQRIKKQAAGTR